MRFDHHMHIASLQVIRALGKQPGVKPRYAGVNPRDSSSLGIVSSLDEAGFDRAVIISAAYLWGTAFLPVKKARVISYMRDENNWTAGQWKRFPDRLVWLMSVNPLLTDTALAEIDRFRKYPGIAGIKMHFNANGVDLLRPEHLEKLLPVFREAERCRLPVLLHYGMGKDPETPGSISIEALEILIREILLPLPELKLQLAHCCGLYSKATEHVFGRLSERIKKDPGLRNRVWVDISAVMIDGATAATYKGLLSPTAGEDFTRISTALRNFGLDHVLFGSDYSASPTMNPRDYSRFVAENSDFSQQELETVFSNPGPFFSPAGAPQGQT